MGYMDFVAIVLRNDAELRPSLHFFAHVKTPRSSIYRHVPANNLRKTLTGPDVRKQNVTGRTAQRVTRILPSKFVLGTGHFEREWCDSRRRLTSCFLQAYQERGWLVRANLSARLACAMPCAVR